MKRRGLKVRTGVRFPVPPLIVGPRCTMPVPCGHCWFCLTWPERRKQLRYERPWEPR
jgi:hypothetical protein